MGHLRAFFSIQNNEETYKLEKYSKSNNEEEWDICVLFFPRNNFFFPFS